MFPAKLLFQLANFSQVNICVLTLRTCSAEGGNIVLLDKEMVTNHGAARLTCVYLYWPVLSCVLSVCLSAPKPEDGETGEDFFERVGRICRR